MATMVAEVSDAERAERIRAGEEQNAAYREEKIRRQSESKEPLRAGGAAPCWVVSQAELELDPSFSESELRAVLLLTIAPAPGAAQAALAQLVLDLRGAAAVAVDAVSLPSEGLDANAWLRSRSRIIGAIGIGLIAFVVLWNVGGPDITLIAAALVGIVLIAVALLASRDDGTDEQAAREGG